MVMKKTTLLIITTFLLWNMTIYSQEEKMEIQGAIQIANSEDPKPDAGTIQWTGSDFEGYNGSQWMSLTSGSGDTGVATDIDGNEYLTVLIGTQTWMKENLRTARYKDGTPIAKVTDTVWAATDSTGKYCWFDNDENEYDMPYGKLYNWYAVNDIRGLCPTGWHVPTDTEWTTLTDFLGGIGGAGGKMKIPETVIWNSPNTGATNESGFTGLPGGFRTTSSSFNNIGFIAYFWSSTESDSSNAWYRRLNNSNADVNTPNGDKRVGFSVRCLRD